MNAIAAAISAMRAKGFADADILDIVAEMAAADVAPATAARTARQERNRRYYVSKRLKASYSDVSDADSDDAEIPLQKKGPQTPKENYPLSSEPTVLRCESARRNVWPADFAKQVWDAYPRKTEKQPAMAALTEVHRKDRLDWQTLMVGIENLSANVEPKFAPALHRWLKKERWTDQHVAQPQARAGPQQRKTFGQIAREAANNIAGQDDEPHFHRQADAFDGPSLDLVAGEPGASIVDLQSRRAAGAAW
jgi:hypothetical protein